MPESHVLSEMIEQVGTGGAAFSSIQRLAAAAVRDGIDAPAVQAVSTLGSDGAWPSNIERDAHVWLRNLHNSGLRLYNLKMEVCLWLQW